MVRLEPMTEEDFQTSRRHEISRHAAEQVREGVWTQGAALEASGSDFGELLPHGLATPNRHFSNIIDEKSDDHVGETWYLVAEKGGKTHFWIDWIWIEPQYRRRGYATEVLRLLAEEAARLGADRVGLSVVSENTGAVALYSKLGYATRRMHMVKMLTPTPPKRH